MKYWNRQYCKFSRVVRIGKSVLKRNYRTMVVKSLEVKLVQQLETKFDTVKVV